MKGYGVTTTGHSGWLEHPRPTAGPLDAIVRPTTVAPCTSDTHTMHGGAGPIEDRILGHEAVGEVVEVGKLVKDFKPGDIVVVPCLTPNWLKPGIQEKYTAHESGPMTGFKFIFEKDGVFGELFHVNCADANLVHLPKNISAEAAVITVDMMSTGFHGVELADVKYGDSVVVIGIGPVGLMAVAGAKLRGAGHIIGVGTRPGCVALAREYGANDILSYKEGDLVEKVLAFYPGGVDAVVVAGGNQDTFRQSVEMLKPGGTVGSVLYYDSNHTLSMPATSWDLGMGNKNICSGFCPGGAARIKRMLNVIEFGRVDPAKMITHRYEGFEKIEDAFLVMADKPQDLVKPCVTIKW